MCIGQRLTNLSHGRGVLAGFRKRFLGWRLSLLFGLSVERQFPVQGIHVLPDDVGRTVVTGEFEIPVVRAQPSIDNPLDPHHRSTEPDTFGFLIHPMA